MSSLAGRCGLSLAIVTSICGVSPPASAQMRKAWVATYDGPGMGSDVPSALRVDREGNVVISGVSTSSSTGLSRYRYVTIKYDVGGARRWVVSHGDSSLELEPPVLAVDAEGNVVVAGTHRASEISTPDFLTVKFSPEGTELWKRSCSGSRDSSDTPVAAAFDEAGNVLVTGTSGNSSTFDLDYLTVKYAPDGTELWVRRFDGSSNGVDTPVGLAVDGAGNVVVAGTSWAARAGPSDFATVKYSPEGDLLWTRVYDGAAGSLDQVKALALDAAGDVYVTGSSIVSEDAGFDSTTIRYSSDGTERWVRTYGGAGRGNDDPRAIALDSAGNVFVAGQVAIGGESEDTDFATLKYSPDGELLWVRSYGGPNGQAAGARGIAVDAAGNVHVTGESTDESDRTYDFATLKYANDGRLLWVHRYDGANHGNDRPCGLGLDGGGNVFVAGRSDVAGGGGDYATLKLDPDGRPLWLETYAGPGSLLEAVAALALDRSGNALVTGRSRNQQKSFDFTTVKYSPAGTELWVRRYDGPTGSSDVPTALAIDGAGSIFVTGKSYGDPATQCDYATVKYDVDGKELWNRLYGGPGGFDDVPCAVAVDADGNAVVTGESPGLTETNLEFVTLKYDPEGRELWVRRHGGVGRVLKPRGLAIDAAGDVFVTGAGHFGDERYSDFVTVKYSADGVELWVRRFDGPDGLADVPVGIAVDASGNVHVAGDSILGGETGRVILTVKYAPDGTEHWFHEFDGSTIGSNHCGGIAVSASGKVYVAGLSLGDSWSSDWVTFAYERDGNELWTARHADERSGGQVPKSLVLDAVGNVLVAGSLGAPGVSDYAGVNAVVKYDPHGSLLWATQQPVGISALAADAEGGVYVAGVLDDDFATVKYEPPPLRRGLIDADGDLDITDAILLLQYLFLEGEEPPCLDAADVDDDGAIALADAVLVLGHLFRGGLAPEDPCLECGRDFTLDSLECKVSEPCSPSRGLPKFVFFGREFQADGVFFVVDRSGSMADQGELTFAKREISTAIAGFSETVEFGIVFFDGNPPVQFPSNGLPATAEPAVKLEAMGFVESIEPGYGSCCLPGFLAGFRLAEGGRAVRKILIYVGDGGGTCQGANESVYLREARRAIEASNTSGVEIHCMTMPDGSGSGDEFPRRLAWDTGGSYVNVAE